MVAVVRVVCVLRGDMRCWATGRGVGRFGDAVSCGGACRERGVERDVWRDEGRDDDCAVFVSSIWPFPYCLVQRGVLGELSTFSTVE